MSGGGEHLKDEVGLVSVSNSSVMAKLLRQGSKSQVFIAGATAGLVSRYKLYGTYIVTAAKSM